MTIFAGIFLLAMMNLVSASNDYEMKKVASLTLTANDNSDVVNLKDVLNPAFWGSNVMSLNFPSNLESELVNGIELEEGIYIARIKEGAWSRWESDLIDTTTSTGYLGDIGNQGLTWESTANIVYNDSGLKIRKFGGLGLFASEQEAENAGVESETIFKHNGGKVYLFLDDDVISDNRGSVKINIYEIKSLDIPDNSCYWPMDNQVEAQNWAINNHNELMFWVPSLTVEPRILCYDGTWYVTEGRDRAGDISTLRKSASFPDGYEVAELGDKIGDWKVVRDRSWGSYPGEVQPGDYQIIWKLIEDDDDDNGDNDRDRNRNRFMGFDTYEPVWQCSGWGDCIDGQVRTRTCTDLNAGEFSYNKPAETMGCDLSTIDLEAENAAGVVDKTGFNWNTLMWWVIGGIVLLIILIIIVGMVI